MKNLLIAYLLAKAALGLTFRWLDIGLAKALRTAYVEPGEATDEVSLNMHAPEWLRAIAGMEIEAPLPEAFDWALFRDDDYEVEE